MPSSKKDKHHIKFLYVLKPSKHMKSVDISILTDDNSYFEYTLELRTDVMTKYVARRIRSLFDSFLIDSRTDVVVNPLLDEGHLVYQYFMLLKQHIGFRLKVATLDKMVSRIHYFFTRHPAKRRDFNAVWKKIIESKICPWITQAVEYQLQNKGSTSAQRLRHTRLAMFYLVVKNYLMK